MKAGDVVMVYCDPVTRTDLEGEARLKRADPNFMKALGEGLERWYVEFLAEPHYQYLRVVGKYTGEVAK